MKFLGFCKRIRILEREIRIAWRRLSHWKMDSNPWNRDSNRLKIFWLLENRFESSIRWFESPKTVLCTGKRIQISRRGIWIAKAIFQTTNILEKGFESLKKRFESLMHQKMPENVQHTYKFHSSYKHTTQKDLTNMNV